MQALGTKSYPSLECEAPNALQRQTLVDRDHVGIMEHIQECGETRVAMGTVWGKRFVGPQAANIAHCACIQRQRQNFLNLIWEAA